MSSHWSALFSQLVRSTNRHSARRIFATIFPDDHPPAGFRTPEELLTCLHGPGPDAEEKNTVLAHLLRLAGRRDSRGDLAVELLLLALWPGLSAVRLRLRQVCPIDRLEAELVGQMAVAIRQADPVQVTRVAATLLRNLERDLKRTLIREARLTPTDDGQDRLERLVAEPETISPEVILERARAMLGTDGALLVAVHIAGFSQREAAEALGIGHEACRKRCQRALARLRANFET